MSIRPIISESKYVDSEITNIMQKIFLKELANIESILNLQNLQDLKEIVEIENIIEIKRFGIKVLIEKPSIKNKNAMIVQTNLLKLDFYLDFLCMLKFIKDLKENITILEKLSDFYLILIKHQFFEEQFLLEKNIEIDLKKNNLPITIKKYFIQSIKNIP